VAQYYTLDQHLIVPEVLVMAKSTFDKLSAEDQEAVRQAARDSVPVMRELWQAREKESEARVRAAGVEIITDIDKTPFIEAMVPVYQKYVTSPKLQQMVADIQATE
jgi:TRAP-type C4-dicarboxylate transport system substrate-binding protein